VCGAYAVVGWPWNVMGVIEREERLVWLSHEIAFDACGAAGALAAGAGTERILRRAGRRALLGRRTLRSRRGSAWRCWRRARRVLGVVGETRRRTPVALELLLDPVDGPPVAVRAFSSVAEVRQAFDGGLVAFEL